MSANSKPMSKMLKYTGIFFAIVFSVYGAKKLMFLWFMSRYQPPPVTVSASAVQIKNWQSYVSAVGTLNAMNGVDLASETPGIIEEIRFNSGQFVRKGDVLIIMRSTMEKANLKQSQAQLQLTEMNYQREKTLFNKNVSTQAALDMRYAELLKAQANLEAIQAQIQQKTITAPFDGKLGIRQVNLGQYIAQGTPIVTLQALNPMYVLFNLPEQYLSNLQLGQPVDININSGENKLVSGSITAINSKVDQNTRNVLIQVTIPNDKLQLYPGMYGLVKVWLKEKNNTIVIPQTAIAYGLSGDYVFIVKNESKDKNKPDLHVYRQFIKVGERRNQEAEIKKGLKVGDQIVTSGQLKLQDSTKVLIDNSVEL